MIETDQVRSAVGDFGKGMSRSYNSNFVTFSDDFLHFLNGFWVENIAGAEG